MSSLTKIAAGPLLLFLLSSSSYAEAETIGNLSTQAIVGTWKLEEFVRVTPDGKEAPWCKGAYGFLTYTNEGYMSASINCDKDTPTDAPAKAYNNMLLYSGTYQLRSNAEVVHHVTNSSQLDLLGKEMVRKVASLEKGVLTLTGEAANNRGAFRIVWKKAAKIF